MKISESVSKGLASAIQQVKTNINDPDDIENVSMTPSELLDSDVKAKRKRRTKKEIAADNITAESQEENSLFKALNNLDEQLDEQKKESRPKNHDEFCEQELAQAKIKGLPEPDFDYRNLYEKGNTIYYVRVLPRLGEKEIKKLYLRTIYPRLIVGSEEKGCCECIGYNERDLIFTSHHLAKQCMDAISVAAIYATDSVNDRDESDYQDNENNGSEGILEPSTDMEE